MSNFSFSRDLDNFFDRNSRWLPVSRMQVSIAFWLFTNFSGSQSVHCNWSLVWTTIYHMTITWNNYFMRIFVMIHHSFHIDSFSITKRFTWSILTASFTNTCSLYCRALVYQKRFAYSAKGLNIRTCFFAFELKCSIFLRRGSIVPQWGQMFLWIGPIISHWCSTFLRIGSIIPQWGSIFLRRGSIILPRGSVKQVFLVWGLCTTKLRSICKRTGCLWRENHTCWLSRLVKLRWNTTEIRRTYRPKS